MAHRGATTLLQRTFLVVVRLDPPCLAGFFYVVWLESMTHSFGNGMQLGMHSVPFVVGVGAKLDARRWNSLLTAMTLAHRVSFRDGPDMKLPFGSTIHPLHGSTNDDECPDRADARAEPTTVGRR